MAKLPIMPLYTDALIADTTHLNNEEFGAYLRILIAAWRNNGQALPNDPALLARFCHVSQTHFRRVIWPALAGFFDVETDAFLHQKKLETVWRSASEKHDDQSRAGRASALKRWKTPVTDPSSRLQPNANSVTHSVTTIHEPSKEEEAVGTASPPLRPPFYVQNAGAFRTSPQRGAIAQFAAWWDEYPHRVSKRSAAAAYARALKRTSPGELIAGLRRYVQNQPPERQWLNPAKWLRDQRWLDQPANDDHRRTSHASQRRRSPVENLYLGAAMAVENLERRDRERERDRQEAEANNARCLDQPPPVALLDRR